VGYELLSNGEIIDDFREIFLPYLDNKGEKNSSKMSQNTNPYGNISRQV